MSTPQSIIHICSGVRLDNRYEHSIYFGNATAQQDYFAGKVVKTFPAYSYLRKSWPLQVQATMEQAKTWTYLYFHNGPTGKIYYYFITQVEYKNDNTVELTLEMDVLQTYLFDFELLDCFVERQHTETDVLGEYTMDEGLEVGELKESHASNMYELDELCILVLASINPNYSDTGTPVDALGYMYDNVFSGLKVFAIEATRWAEWETKLSLLSSAGFIEGIVSMWMYPKELVNLGGESTWAQDELCKPVKGSKATWSEIRYWHKDYKVIEKIGDYTPKNKKVLCYPYRFLYVSNNQGGGAVYRFERFANPEQPGFKLAGCVSPDATVKLYPRNYNGVSDIAMHEDSGTTPNHEVKTYGNYDHGLTLSNFPVCAWDVDVYKLWLAQNQNQLQHSLDNAGLTILGSGLGAVASAFMGNPMGVAAGVGGVISGARQIEGIMAQKADMAIQPPQARGAFSTGVNVGAHMQTFTFYTKEVDYEHAKAIDDYFTMYGYRLNRVRKPNLCARPAFTYIKTVGCNIAGKMRDDFSGHSGCAMCTEDRIKITSIFDRGVTFWARGDKIGDYSQSNTV